MTYLSPGRGARLARREERAYWAYVSDEQRRQTPGSPPRGLLRGGVEEGCPARELGESSRIQGTSPAKRI